jgi:hypothetical protein
MLISQPAKKRFSILAFCDYLFLFAFAVACFFVVIPSRICCCYCHCLFLCLSSGRGSAVAIALVCFFVCHPVRDLLLPLSVPAVILTLSEVEWGRIPKNSTSPDHPYFSTITFCAVACSCFQTSKTVISTEAAHEQRSGEIRFSTKP